MRAVISDCEAMPYKIAYWEKAGTHFQGLFLCLQVSKFSGYADTPKGKVSAHAAAKIEELPVNVRKAGEHTQLSLVDCNCILLCMTSSACY